MNSFAVIISLVATVAFGVWFAWRLTSIIKADGYGLRSSSGLPRDWSPNSQLPSIPHALKPSV